MFKSPAGRTAGWPATASRGGEGSHFHPGSSSPGAPGFFNQEASYLSAGSGWANLILLGSLTTASGCSSWVFIHIREIAFRGAPDPASPPHLPSQLPQRGRLEEIWTLGLILCQKFPFRLLQWSNPAVAFGCVSLSSPNSDAGEPLRRLLSLVNWV